MALGSSACPAATSISGGTGGGEVARCSVAKPRAALFYRTLLPRRREVVRDWDRHLPGRGPCGAALERGDEPDAPHAVEVVAHRRVEHAALAVADGPDHR